MNPRVIKVTANEDFTLLLEFDSDETRRFDMSAYLERGVFKKLKDVGRFKAAYVAYGTVVWPEGLDIAPETLYVDGTAV